MQPQKRASSRFSLALLMILALTAGLGLGLFLGWVVWPVRYVDTTFANLAVEHQEQYIVLVGAAYARDHDLEKAKARLAQLEAANINQWVANLADTYITEGRAEADIQALVELAHGLGVDTPRMVAYLATPTPLPTDTPLPTPTPTATPLPSDTPVPTATPLPSTDTPLPPSDTPPPPAPTDTPRPTAAPPTPTPRPQPTNTPQPRPTATPTNTPSPPAGPWFTIVESRMMRIEENAGCEGNHNIFVEVRDKNGAPLSGVVVCRYWSLQIDDPGACKITGVTDDKPAGWAEFDLHMATDQVYIAPEIGSQIRLSPLSDKFSTIDEEIPISWLLGAGYCESEEDCQQRLQENRLCRGHYSYKIVFQKVR